jgi:hypothetical protein
MKKLSIGKLCAGAFLAVSAFFCGCEPYNAEKFIPLPIHVWDRAVKNKDFQAYEIKNMEFQEFVTIKALLQTSGFDLLNLDIFLAPEKEGAKPLRIPTFQAEIIVKGSVLVEGKHPAAAYISKEKRLIVGFAELEK